jgi:hypothetical protein
MVYLARSFPNPRPLRERESHESFDKLRTGFSEWQGEGFLSGAACRAVFLHTPHPAQGATLSRKGRG